MVMMFTESLVDASRLNSQINAVISCSNVFVVKFGEGKCKSHALLGDGRC